MAFTEHLFDKDDIKALARQRAAALKENRGFSDFPGFALGVIERRLAKDPLRYRDYGPYWWAVKALMIDSGRELGERDDPMVRAAYQGDSREETIVMADEFRTLYLATQAVGTNQFLLDGESGDLYTLEDEDMESRLPGT
ncbi:hypothetical protein [Halomonas salipaludis]|uniref:Uncharacterized protein n=1 Tax=Halomonas salipaludis TaxID=2032625 RepID=A0A2A2F3Z4_9GAMM|nr:hypothetical protein [Halomonas salipaludis]PAU79243.1 hypothetical protein CK498_02410 [Halomonas salipaludis]